MAGATGLEPATSGVTGRQFCNDFNVSWNVFLGRNGLQGGAKVPTAFPAILPQFVEQKPGPAL